MSTAITYGSVSIRYGVDTIIKQPKYREKLFPYEFVVGIEQTSSDAGQETSNEEDQEPLRVSELDEAQLYLTIPVKNSEDDPEFTKELLPLPSLGRVEQLVEGFFGGKNTQKYDEDTNSIELSVGFGDKDDENDNYIKQIIPRLKFKKEHLGYVEENSNHLLCLAETGVIADNSGRIAETVIDGRTHTIKVDKYGRITKSEVAEGAQGNAKQLNGHEMNYYLNPTYDKIYKKEIKKEEVDSDFFPISRTAKEDRVNWYIFSKFKGSEFDEPGVQELSFSADENTTYDIFTIESSEENECVFKLGKIYIRPGDAYKIWFSYDEQDKVNNEHAKILEYLPTSSRVNSGSAGMCASNTSANSVLLGDIKTGDANGESLISEKIELINIGFGNKIEKSNDGCYPTKAAVLANNAYVLRNNETVLSSCTINNTKVQSGTVSFAGDIAILEGDTENKKCEWSIPCYLNSLLNGEISYNILGNAEQVQSGTISFVARSQNGAVSLIDHYATTEMSNNTNDGINTPTIAAEDRHLLFSVSSSIPCSVSAVLHIKNETIQIES